MIKGLKKEVKYLLSQERWEHTQGVIETAMQLLVDHNYSIDPHRLQTAALLHDCAKDLSFSAQLKKAADFGIVLTSSDLLCPRTLHGPVGAGMARHMFGIVDIDILQAIALHTTGGPRMTALAKIIFVADYIEPGRDFSGVEGLRTRAAKNLDGAVLACMNHTLAYLLKHGNLIHRRMITARNYLLAIKLGPDLREEG